MKLAIVVALSEDKRRGVPITDLLPYDQAVAKFKSYRGANTSPVVDYPHLAVWTASGVTKSHKCRACEVPAAAPEEPQPELVEEPAAEPPKTRAKK